MNYQVISKSAKIGKNVKFGYFCVIGEGVVIRENTVIGSGVFIHNNTIIGKNCIVCDNTVLGKQPKSLKTATFKTKAQRGLILGSNCFVGALSLIYAGVDIDSNVYIADKVSIREGTTIGKGAVIGRCVDIDHDVSIGQKVKIQSGALIADGSIIEEGAFIGPQVVTVADKYMLRDNVPMFGPKIKKFARIGGNATILPHIVIGRDALVGAGALVTKDVKDEFVVVNNPGRAIRKINPEHRKKR